MERLTRYRCTLDYKGEYAEPEVGVSNEDIVNRLAELEDKLESGEALELPCKVCDSVYYVTQVDDGDIYFTILEGHVACFNIEARCQKVLVRYVGGLTFWHDFSDFGKSVFVSPEQAKNRLKEIQDE